MAVDGKARCYTLQEANENPAHGGVILSPKSGSETVYRGIIMNDLPPGNCYCSFPAQSPINEQNRLFSTVEFVYSCPLRWRSKFALSLLVNGFVEAPIGGRYASGARRTWRLTVTVCI